MSCTSCRLDGESVDVARSGEPLRTLVDMIWFLIVLILVAVVAYRFRLQILSKLLGQSQSRVQRALERRKRE
jgi:hypothetical protein